MAGGPYEDSYGNKYIIWDQKGFDRAVKESLKTKKEGEAKERKTTLETLHRFGKHHPDKIKWYYNDKINHIVQDGYLDISALTSDRDVIKTIPLQQGVEQYIAHKKSQRGKYGWKTDRTITTHSQTLNQFADYIGPSTPIDHLTEDDLDSFYQHPGFESDYTKKSARARVDAMIKWFVEKNYLEEYIDAEVDEPQTEVKQYVRQETMLAIFDKMEEEALKTMQGSKHTSHTADTRWYADFCRMNYDTGLRGIEQIKLRTQDITGSDIYVGKSFRVKTNFQRKVAIGDGLARRVIDKYTDPEVRADDPYLSKSDHLFGRSSQSSRKRISSALKKASLKVAPNTEGLTLHNLRHLSAMRWLMLNKDIDEGFRLVLLMQRLGHKQLTTTQKYLNYLPSDGVV